MGQSELDYQLLKTCLCKHKGSIEWETCLPMFDGLDGGWTTSVHAFMDKIGGDFKKGPNLFSNKTKYLALFFML